MVQRPTLARSLGLPTLALAGLVWAGLVWAAPASASPSPSPSPADPSPAGPVDEGLHRGAGWYDADLRIPEPPLALALVIIGAAAMRRRDRRLLAGPERA